MGHKGFQFFGIALVLFMTAYGQDRMKNESILFEDHFDGDSTSKWADMFVWGFGVWKVDGGSFISSRGEALEPALFAALPKVDRAVVRRDFSILFRYRPIQGTFHQFGVQVRQSGLSHYVFTFDSDGSMKIVKVRSGLPNLVLAASQPGIVRYDTWQWIRLKILGDDPASFSVTCWTGIPDDEPSSPQVCGLDRDPLSQANFSLALVSTQQGGARTMVDDFTVQGLVPGSRQWTWIETSTETTVPETDFWKKCSRFFLEGDRTSLRSALEDAGNFFPASWIVDNNRAVFHADQGISTRPFPASTGHS